MDIKTLQRLLVASSISLLIALAAIVILTINLRTGHSRDNGRYAIAGNGPFVRLDTRTGETWVAVAYRDESGNPALLGWNKAGGDPK